MQAVAGWHGEGGGLGGVGGQGRKGGRRGVAEKIMGGSGEVAAEQFCFSLQTVTTLAGLYFLKSRRVFVVLPGLSRAFGASSASPSASGVPLLLDVDFKIFRL